MGMELLKEVLEIIKFPRKLDFESITKELSDTNFFGIKDKDAVKVQNNEFIEYYQFWRPKEKEFWTSLDIFIKQDAISEVIKLINEYMSKKKIAKIEGVSKLKKIQGMNDLYSFVLDSKIQIDFSVNHSNLLIQIVRFDN